MAVTAFISRLKAHSAGPSDQDLGMDLGLGSQVPMSETTTSSPSSRYLQSPELALAYLKSIYTPLKRHYDWFRRTQRGQIKQYGRWPSGMDGRLPRGPPHAGELHLVSWMGFSRTMREIAEFVGVGEVDDAAVFEEIEQATRSSRRRLTTSTVNLHWNEDEQMYYDSAADAFFTNYQGARQSEDKAGWSEVDLNTVACLVEGEESEVQGRWDNRMGLASIRTWREVSERRVISRGWAHVQYGSAHSGDGWPASNLHLRHVVGGSEGGGRERVQDFKQSVVVEGDACVPTSLRVARQAFCFSTSSARGRSR
ncbi:hypothetical protein B0H21DRAFT_864540 [Amylocystis lapponica]|nr:hypothetical protein B0H21DRAFT_864540 [Amylocystis lapponica]